MSYEVIQTRRFARQYKKLHDNVAADVDAAVLAVADQPSIGERKKGDLAELLVYKFRSQGQLYLLGYTSDEGVQLIYGSHRSAREFLPRSQTLNWPRPALLLNFADLTTFEHGGAGQR